jgi:hypothetical protein
MAQNKGKNSKAELRQLLLRSGAAKASTASSGVRHIDRKTSMHAAIEARRAELHKSA